MAHLAGLAPKTDEDPLRYELTDADATLTRKKGAAVLATAGIAERLAAPKPWLSGAAAQADTAQLERAKQIQRRPRQLNLWVLDWRKHLEASLRINERGIDLVSGASRDEFANVITNERGVR